jgi:hypothetical protein
VDGLLWFTSGSRTVGRGWSRGKLEPECRDAIGAGAVLTGANLTGAVLSYAQLTGAKLGGGQPRRRGTDLTGASLVKTNFSGVDPTSAKLGGDRSGPRRGPSTVVRCPQTGACQRR